MVGLVYLVAFLLPGFLLGWVLGIWGIYISIGAFVLFTVYTLVLASPNTSASQGDQFNASKMWTHSIFWIIGSLLGQLI